MDEWEQEQAQREQEAAEREREAAEREREAAEREREAQCNEARSRLNEAVNRISVLESEESRLHEVRRGAQASKDQLDISFSTAGGIAGSAQTAADAAAAALRQAETDLSNAEQKVIDAEQRHADNQNSFSPTGITWPITGDAAANARSERDHLRDSVVPRARSASERAASELAAAEEGLATIARERETLRSRLVTIGSEIQNIGEQLTPVRSAYGLAKNDVERYCGDGW